MNEHLKRILITLAVIIGLLPIGLFLGSIFMYADFFSNPSEKECIKIVCICSEKGSGENH